jgi:hypothetical protein
VNSNYAQDDVASWLRNYIPIILKADDVMREEFLQAVILTGDNLRNETSAGFLETMKLYKTKSVRTMTLDKKMLPGPYYTYDGALWQILRLYQDSQNAFLVAVQPTIFAARYAHTESLQEPLY